MFLRLTTTKALAGRMYFKRFMTNTDPNEAIACVIRRTVIMATACGADGMSQQLIFAT